VHLHGRLGILVVFTSRVETIFAADGEFPGATNGALSSQRGHSLTPGHWHGFDSSDGAVSDGDDAPCERELGGMHNTICHSTTAFNAPEVPDVDINLDLDFDLDLDLDLDHDLDLGGLDLDLEMGTKSDCGGLGSRLTPAAGSEFPVARVPATIRDDNWTTFTPPDSPPEVYSEHASTSEPASFPNDNFNGPDDCDRLALYLDMCATA